MLVLASGTQSLALGGGCTLYLRDALVPSLAIGNGAGCASAALSLPLDVGLRGVAVHAQGIVVDPMGAFAGLAFSQGLRIVLGD